MYIFRIIVTQIGAAMEGVFGGTPFREIDGLDGTLLTAKSRFTREKDGASSIVGNGNRRARP